MCGKYTIGLLSFQLMMYTGAFVSVTGSATKYIKDPYVTMEPIGSGWKKPSLLSCAVECKTIGQRCRSFIYDEASKLCTPGSVVKRNTSHQAPGQGRLYSIACDLGSGSEVITHKNTRTCLWLSDNLATFDQAIHFCQEKNSQLMTAKTPEKLEILIKMGILHDEDFWVGLDDRNEEGVFRWHLDGTVVSNTWMKKLFGKGQPDNYCGDEDCVSFSHYAGLLNDAPCGSYNNYLCEVEEFH